MAIALRADISDYSNRVLGVIKEKFGLRDKSEAINKFAEMFGEEFVEKEVNEDVIRNLVKTCESHMEKYSRKKMSLKELDNLCGM